MKKVLYFTAGIGWFFVPLATEASIQIPYFNVTVIENSVGGDAVFNFQLNAYNPVLYDSQSFQIETKNGSGSYTASTAVGVGSRIVLTESREKGWSNSGIVCASDNPQVVVSPAGNSVTIYPAPYSSVTCTFTNTKQIAKTPVLFVPGILGTEMKKGDDLLWVDLGKLATNFSGDDFMDPLTFNAALRPTDINVTTANVLSKKGFSIFTFDYSDGLVNEFKNQGYAEGTSSDAALFTFPYDWRYGVSGVYSTGSTTADFLRQKIEDIRAQTGSDKVDVIAHSTGGLLVKKYVAEHPGDHHIGKIVFVGVPNLGAPKAVKVLLQGDNFKVPFLSDSEMKKIAQNLPVSYDLVPSRSYVNKNGGFVSVADQASGAPVIRTLDYDATGDFLVTDHGLNQAGWNGAEALHTDSFDSFDVRTLGIDAYNIVGCKSGTVGRLTESRGTNGTTLTPQEVAGDGTVPMESAGSIVADAGRTFYALKADHGKMPSAEGIRQEIVNIIAGTTLPVGGVITEGALAAAPDRCKLSGHLFGLFSPAAIEVIDGNGNRSGIASDGSIENDIPGASYEVWGEHTFVFVPTDENQTYAINLKGTGAGTFTLKDETIVNDAVEQAAVFSNLPVAPGLAGAVRLGATTALSFDANGDGVPEAISPSAIISGKQTADLVPPLSKAALSGLSGEPGFYRSDVGIVLSAVDPAVAGHEDETSGVLATKYSLDGGGYRPYDAAQPITASGEGTHTLSFFSTDRAGNNEPAQALSFVIDKTPPELAARFDPAAEDLAFTGTDAGATGAVAVPAAVAYDDDAVTATDRAGNTATLALRKRDEKRRLKAEFVSLRYNGIPSTLPKNSLDFSWLFDRKGALALLVQHARSKDFSVSAVYGKGRTVIAGRGVSGKTSKIADGLALLQVATDKGVLRWSFSD